MNKQLMQKVRDHISDHPDEFDMNSYFFNDTDGLLTLRLVLGKSCATTCCIAGRAVVLSDAADVKRVRDGLRCDDVSAIAKRLMGLGNERLFEISEWPNKSRYRPDAERSVAECALALLDDMLDGRDPWAARAKAKVNA